MNSPMQSQMKPAAERGRQLQAALSRKLQAMARNLDNKLDTGTVMAPEDIAALAQHVRTFVADARALEASKSINGTINAAAESAFRTLIQAETHLGLARSAVVGRLASAEADPDGTLAQSLRDISGQIEDAADALAGRGRAQS